MMSCKMITWRELRDQINKLPESVLNRPALIRVVQSYCVLFDKDLPIEEIQVSDENYSEVVILGDATNNLVVPNL